MKRQVLHDAPAHSATVRFERPLTDDEYALLELWLEAASENFPMRDYATISRTAIICFGMDFEDGRHLPATALAEALVGTTLAKVLRIRVRCRVIS
jgi:hypothetical protein